MAGKINLRYALISVYDKTGIVEFARKLQKLNYQIISTGGTAKLLSENKINAIPVEKITDNPESFDGRMKTISYQIESGILFDRTNKKHVKEAEAQKIKPIDIVVCSLYPFEKTVSDPLVEQELAIENIDVGGPTMIRAAAKNFKNVVVVVSPNDYEETAFLLKENKVSLEFKQKLAAKAFAHISLYDSLIANYLNSELFPEEKTLPLRRKAILRYGENPHQKAAFYNFPNTRSPLSKLKKHWGRELSYVNLTDINAGLESVSLFTAPCAAVIKHNTPCGLSLGRNPAEALKRAIESDPESAFGGVIVINQIVNLETAKVIGNFKETNKSNIDILASVEIEKDALEYLQKVRKSMGIYTFGEIDKKSNGLFYKAVNRGMLVQTTDQDKDESSGWKTVTKKKPTKKQLKQMEIAWKFISRIKSNAIVIMDRNKPMVRGIGCGQTSRIRSTRIALEQAHGFTKGALLASDSFFPFADSVKLAARYGISSIIQQGGSINDRASIDEANKLGIAMVFTNRRAFWH